MSGIHNVGQETVPNSIPHEHKNGSLPPTNNPKCQQENNHKSSIVGYGSPEDKSLWIRGRFYRLNPVVCSFAMTIIIIFIVWAMVNPNEAKEEFGSWKAWVGHNFTWLYIGSQDAWFVFIIVVYMYYGNIKLGPDDSKPEYNNVSWFTMLFACGVSTGLFFYGVAECVYHYTGKNRYSADPTMPDNKLAQEAILVTLYHWGFHGWVVYTIVGLLISLMAHRVGLPLTMKSCFYPLIGDQIFGWPGDLVDTVSIIATLFGVCTSLGLGTIQINEGLKILNPEIPINSTVQVIIIWCITSVATVSVLTGVKYGIRRISEICFVGGLVVLFITFAMDNTTYLLNLYVQSFGYYFQYIVQIGFHCDAFEQLGPSNGAEDRDRFLPVGVASTDGPAEWMNGWTIFYWGWWIAWCPFVGMFIAKISHGRTVSEFIMGTMTAPVAFVFIWLCTFGGCGIRMEREAAGAGLCCHNMQMDLLKNLTLETPESIINLPDLCKDGDCNPCTTTLLQNATTYEQLLGEVNSIGEAYWGVSMADRSLTRLSCNNLQRMWFDLMQSYSDLGPFLSVFSLISLILYFVTSSDSGSLVIDCLSSNGHPEPPRLQRFVWAIIEGLAATALLVSGGSKALNALQAVSIATGLIYTILMCVACVALWRALAVVSGEIFPEEEPKFSVQLLEPLMAAPYKEVCSNPSKMGEKFVQFLANFVIAPLSVGKAAGRVFSPSHRWPVTAILGMFLTMFVAFHIFQLAFDGAWALAWVFYISFGAITAAVRSEVRNVLSIRGSLLEDFILSLVIYPAVALQMDITLMERKEVPVTPGRNLKNNMDMQGDVNKAMDCNNADNL